MTLIAVTQRMEMPNTHGEIRDALDQRWTRFLLHCDLVPLILPNNKEAAEEILKRVPCKGFLLTGGGDLPAFGGQAAARDSLEQYLIAHAIAHRQPLIGVCRGMQMIQKHFSVHLQSVSGHVALDHTVVFGDTVCLVNSYHAYGAFTSTQDLEILARAPDGVVEAVRHRHYPLQGMMWHPERTDLFHDRDVALFKAHYQS